MPPTKRKNSVSPPSTPPSKRPRPSSQYAQIDSSTGQRTAFPGLDDCDDEYEEGEYEEDGDKGAGGDGTREALRYLRAVRAEAATIPTLLVAPPENDRAIYDSGVGDSRGFYSDGAYIAAPTAPDSPPSLSEGHPQDVQSLYHARIISRFLALRAKLSGTPPAEVLERVSVKQGCFMGGGAGERRRWKKILRGEETESARLAGMQKGTVLNLIGLVGGREVFAGVGGKGVSRRMGAWVWGLLARCPERGELVSEEVGVLRELGKTAVWTAAGLKGLDLGALEGGEEEEGGDLEVDVGDARDTMDGEEDEYADFWPEQEKPSQQVQLDDVANPIDNVGVDDVEDLAAARARLLARLEDEKEQSNGEFPLDVALEEIPSKLHTPNEDIEDDDLSNTRATIDMIITIVGELYGQRDLLEFREAWE